MAAAAIALLLLWLSSRRLPTGHLIAVAALRLRGAGPAGVLGGAAAFVLAPLLLAPIVPMFLAAGWVWGPWAGLFALPCAVASAALSFLAARRLGGERGARWLRSHRQLGSLVLLAESGGAATVALLRLSLLIPFMPGNAALGLTRLRLRELLLGSALGMLPQVLLALIAGALLPDAEALERGEGASGAPALLLFGVGALASLAIATAAARKLRASADPGR